MNTEIRHRKAIGMGVTSKTAQRRVVVSSKVTRHRCTSCSNVIRVQRASFPTNNNALMNASARPCCVSSMQGVEDEAKCGHVLYLIKSFKV
jgi:hypothetical protein